jgi:hypothetical protein
MDALAWIFPIAIIVGVIVFFAAKARSERQRQLKEQAAKDQQWAQAAIENLEVSADDTSKLPDLNDNVTNLILHPGERCFAIGQEAQHVVAARRATLGGSEVSTARPATKRITARAWPPMPRK